MDGNSHNHYSTDESPHQYRDSRLSASHGDKNFSCEGPAYLIIAVVAIPCAAYTATKWITAKIKLKLGLNKHKHKRKPKPKHRKRH